MIHTRILIFYQNETAMSSIELFNFHLLLIDIADRNCHPSGFLFTFLHFIENIFFFVLIRFLLEFSPRSYWVHASHCTMINLIAFLRFT